MDADLPFLSFAAGLMAAAEVVKAQLHGYPFSPNRMAFSAGEVRSAVASVRETADLFVSD